MQESFEAILQLRWTVSIGPILDALVGPKAVELQLSVAERERRRIAVFV